MVDEEFKHIVRIQNTDLEGERSIINALKKIQGVGFMLSNTVCKVADVDKKKKAGDLTDKEVEKIDKVLEDPIKAKVPAWLLNRRKDVRDNKDKHLLAGELRFAQENDVKRLKKIKAYRGVRHSKGLPVRGQRTKGNFRSNKGKGSLGVKRKTKRLATEE